MTVHTSASATTMRRASLREHDRFEQVLVIFSLISTIVINALATIVPINGQTTGAISDSFPVYFVPAGYVFSIWSLIYLGLLGYAIYQGLPSQRTNSPLRTIRWPFIVSCIANSAWIFAWHYERFPLTLLFMLLLLGSLILIYTRLRQQGAPSTQELWFVHLPFRLYLGWITVATIANATTLLYHLGWRGAPLNGPTWAVIMLVIATLIGLFFALKLRDVVYTLVLVWAFTGIFVKFGGTPFVGYTALAAAAVLAIGALVALRAVTTQST